MRITDDAKKDVAMFDTQTPDGILAIDAYVGEKEADEMADRGVIVSPSAIKYTNATHDLLTYAATAVDSNSTLREAVSIWEMKELPDAAIVIGDFTSLRESTEWAQVRATELADIPDKNIFPIADIKTAKEQIAQLKKSYNIVRVVNYTGEDIAADITADFGDVKIIAITPVSASAIGIGSSA